MPNVIGKLCYLILPDSFQGEGQTIQKGSFLRSELRRHIASFFLHSTKLNFPLNTIHTDVIFITNLAIRSVGASAYGVMLNKKQEIS